MLRKRVAVLVAAAGMLLSMLAASAPAFAQGVGGCDANPGASEGTSSNHGTPPTQKPGTFHDPHSGKNGTATGVYEQNLSECA